MEWKANDGINQAMRDHVQRGFGGNCCGQPWLVTIGDQHGNQREPTGEQPVDQFFAFDDELLEPPGLVGCFERPVNGDAGIIKVVHRPRGIPPSPPLASQVCQCR